MKNRRTSRKASGRRISEAPARPRSAAPACQGPRGRRQGNRIRDSWRVEWPPASGFRCRFCLCEGWSAGLKAVFGAFFVSVGVTSDILCPHAIALGSPTNSRPWISPPWGGLGAPPCPSCRLGGIGRRSPGKASQETAYGGGAGRPPPQSVPPCHGAARRVGRRHRHRMPLAHAASGRRGCRDGRTLALTYGSHPVHTTGFTHSIRKVRRHSG